MNSIIPGSVSRFFDLNTSSPGKRIEWIDVSKGIFMFCVFICHTEFVPDLYGRIYSPFFLTGFFFLSGYLFHNPDKKFVLSFKLIRAVETILIPYLIYWILSFTVEHLLKRDFNFIPQLLHDIMWGQKFWFISALICTQIMFSIFLSINKEPKYAVLFAVASLLVWYFTPLSKPDIIVPWCFNNALIANFFLGMGYYIKTYQVKFIELIKNNIVGTVTTILFISLIVYNWIILKNEMNFPGNKFGILWVFIAYAVVGIYVVLFLSNKYTRFNWLIIFIGENSLLYYFFQNQVLKVLKVVVRKAGITEPNYIIPVVMALMVAIILVIPILLIKKYFPIMAGKTTFISKKLT